jgi:hypothetical protein
MQMTKQLTVLLLATWVATTAFSYDVAEVEVDEPSALDNLSTTLTVGYDSRYILYGYTGNRHLWHTDIWLSYPLNDKLTLTGGSWYGYIDDGTYEEIDGYTGLDYALTESLYIGVQYSYFNYIEAPADWSDHAHEVAAHISYWGENFSLSVRNHYDDEADGSLTRLIGGYTAPFGEKVALQVDAEVGYAFEYYIDGNAWNHAQIKASLPYQINDQLALTPYIARSIPLSAIDWEQYETYYGLSMSTSF